jgi:cell division protein ZapA
MAEINLTINGRSFGISCDDGQEQRVRDLGYYVDSRVREISRAGAATNEAHLLFLAALMMADEVFELKDNIEDLGGQVEHENLLKANEIAIAQAIDHLADRIDVIATRIQKA